ncbi:MAG: ABC transporter ATP-binding protein [Gammaproteobacteria bacterium]|nr:ABC transporter ATP-binding protein [Gammaproteobacteria bacterium]
MFIPSFVLRIAAALSIVFVLSACSGSPEGPLANLTTEVGGSDDVIAARVFATDTRTADQDGIDGLDPILSTAPQDCYVGVANPNNLPFCYDGRDDPANYYGVTDTWVDANVSVPAYSEGDTFPVILHSHGWGGSKLDLADRGNDCISERGAYDYNCADLGSGIFGKTDNLVREFAHNGYIVISFSERGWGQTEGDIMVMNPYHETYDAMAVLDWLERQADNGTLPIKRDQSGDMVVGTIGGSYGGGFQFPLAVLDSRIDALVPVGTWHSLHESILPNNAVKGGFGNLLCASALANQGGQTRHDVLVEACTNMSSPATKSRAQFDPNNTIVEFMDMNGLDYFVNLQNDNASFDTASPAVNLPAINALLIQGNRDVLFPLQEAANNYRVLSATGGDVRLTSTQGGHFNPVAGFGDTTNHCAEQDPWSDVRRWFDHYLRGADASVISGINEVCISLDDNNAVVLNNMPGQDSSFDSSIAIDQTALNFTVSAIPAVSPSVCETVYTVPDDGETYVLAGVPRLPTLSVDGAAGNVNVAIMGLCLERGGDTILIDEMMTAFEGADYTDEELVAVGELLQAGDNVGVMAYATHPQFSITAVNENQPAANTTSATGTIVLPIFPIGANAVLSTVP